jgi:hypothetical protein
VSSAGGRGVRILGSPLLVPSSAGGGGVDDSDDDDNDDDASDGFPALCDSGVNLYDASDDEQARKLATTRDQHSLVFRGLLDAIKESSDAEGDASRRQDHIAAERCKMNMQQLGDALRVLSYVERSGDWAFMATILASCGFYPSAFERTTLLQDAQDLEFIVNTVVVAILGYLLSVRVR